MKISTMLAFLLTILAVVSIFDNNIIHNVGVHCFTGSCDESVTYFMPISEMTLDVSTAWFRAVT